MKLILFKHKIDIFMILNVNYVIKAKDNDYLIINHIIWTKYVKNVTFLIFIIKFLYLFFN